MRSSDCQHAWRSRPSPRAGGEFGEQPRHALIEHREAFPAGLVAERAGQPRLPGRRSIPRHTAQKQPFDVQIHYPHHPRAGERVLVVREVHHAGRLHFVIRLAGWHTWTAAGMDDRTCSRPACRSSKSQCCRSPHCGIFGPRSTVALLSSASCSTRENGSDVGASERITSRTFFIRATMDAERERLAPEIRAKSSAS